MRVAPRVRPAVPGDAESIARVHTQAWADAYTGLLPAELIAAQTVERRTTQWERTIASDRMACWVAEEGGEVIGVCSIGPAQSDDTIGRIYTIYVPGSHWGRGVGSALWEAAVRGLADLGYAEAELWVLDTNERARRFYEAKGWVTDGEVELDDSFGSPIREVRYRSRRVAGTPT